MDKGQECAVAFKQLLDKRYCFKIGRKGKIIAIEIGFEKVNFHHLMGLHKLTDLHIAKANRAKVFDDILNGNINFSKIEKSKLFHTIKGRIDFLPHLETLLDGNEIIFRYNQKKQSFSHIQAEFLLVTAYDNTDIYIFIDQDSKQSPYFCCSFFPKERTDYTNNQTKYTLLFKEKINLSTGERMVQYDRLTPKISGSAQDKINL